MKKVILAVFFLVSLAFSGRSQTWTPISGRYSYAFLRIDSLLYLPNGPTATRPAPIVNSYWLRYNTDSAGFEYSNGVKWWGLSRRPANDIVIDAPGRDTTITVVCGIAPGSYATTYLKINLPQYIGFRLRVYFGGLVLNDLSGFCATSFYYSGPVYFTFNSSTGDLYIFGPVSSGPGPNVFNISSY